MQLQDFKNEQTYGKFSKLTSHSGTEGGENFRNKDHVKSCPLLGFAKERKSSAAGIDCKVGL